MTQPDIIDLRQRIAAIEGRIHPDSHLELPDSPTKKNRPTIGGQNIPHTLPFGIRDLDDLFANGGLATNTLHEVIGCETRSAGTASGFAMAIAAKLLKQSSGILLWTSDSFLRQEAGALNAEGLHQFGLDPARMLIVNPDRCEDMLWVMEEALGSSAVKVIIGEFFQNRQKLDLGPTRRLVIKAQRHHSMVLLVRHGTKATPNAVQTRWLVRSAASGSIGGFEGGVGLPRWEVELNKNRDGRTGTFTLEWNHAECCFQDATVSVDLAATSANGQDCASEMGEIVALPYAS